MPSGDQSRTVLLIHGGLAENIGARQFWDAPGIVAALESLGWSVLAPDRNTAPTSWVDAAADLASHIDQRIPVTAVAASNGASVGTRLAIDHPSLVSKLVLLWPATAGDPEVDAMVDPAADHLLGGDTLRGVSDAELAAMTTPVAVMAASPENRAHQHRTVDALVGTIPAAARIERDFPESPRPAFAADLEDFIVALTPFL